MNSLTKVKAAAAYLLYWLTFFLFARLLLLGYHAKSMTSEGWRFAPDVVFHGMPLDISILAYFSVIPFLLISFSDLFSRWSVRLIIRLYTFGLIGLVSLLIVIDIELFKAWGTHINAVAIGYLASPVEAFASMASSPLLLLIVLWVLLVVVAVWFYMKFPDLQLKALKKSPPLYIPAYVLMTAALIIPIRGGFQLAPVNQSNVYFSSSFFLNQAAVNPVWNLMHSLSKSGVNKKHPYNYMPKEVAEAKVNARYGAGHVQHRSILRTTRPNIVFVVWESFTAKVVERLGGRPGITPEFEKLISEGVLFSKLYSSGDRSDKGLVSLLSGYPAQPTTSIMKLPEKTAKLPYLSRDLRDLGYETAFYYGGELEFANIKSYLLNGRFEKLVGVQDFPKETLNSKWGAHDGVVFDRLLNDLDKAKQPFFHSIFTLSSHEPFEVPSHNAIKGNDEESLFLNSLHYTDEELGKFIAEAKKKNWWDSTLIVVVADHGHRLPGNSAPFAEEKYHIPMLWLGGALAVKDTVVDHYMSQTDLAMTLLGQLKVMPEDAYRFGKDVFSRSDSASFAFYDFNNGFGLLSPQGKVAFDGVSGLPISEEGEPDVEFGKAYLQVLVEDYMGR